MMDDMDYEERRRKGASRVIEMQDKHLDIITDGFIEYIDTGDETALLEWANNYSYIPEVESIANHLEDKIKEQDDGPGPVCPPYKLEEAKF